MEIDPGLVGEIISLLREIHVKEEVRIPKIPSSGSDDWSRQILSNHADDPVYEELVARLRIWSRISRRNWCS